MDEKDQIIVGLEVEVYTLRADIAKLKQSISDRTINPGCEDTQVISLSKQIGVIMAENEFLRRKKEGN